VKKELSALFVYVGMDHYVSKGGVLGFVITQSVFKTGANEGFRRFASGPEKPFRVLGVSDLSLSLPFDTATNRTAVLLAQKGELTRYPLPYRFWVPTSARPSVDEADLRSVLDCFDVQEWLAAPVEPAVLGSTWLTAPKDAFPILQRIIGDRSEAIMDRAYAGSCTWLNGVFWVDVVETKDRRSVIKNLGEVGRTKVETSIASIENDYLFPLLRGRDVQAWHARASAHILVPHHGEDFSEPVSVAELKRKAPLTFEFLKGFEKPLRKRSGYKQLHKERPEFYVLGNLGNYTLAPYKVVFKDLTEVFQCAVVGPVALAGLAGKPVIPDHTLLFLTCQSRDEAYFLGGVLNSIPCRAALYSASAGVQTQRYFPTDVSRIRLPQFDPKDSRHGDVVRLSISCHESADGSRSVDAPSKEEIELAGIVSELWKIARKEQQHVMDYYTEILTFRSRHGGVQEEAED